ncbi:MAG: xanthine dehydrogenase family protein molybdopterin-binding subunit [Acidobacteria bacterium]|nr:xanthine dehydrogenase family protein molybdopterin-binding subunit [Acidobacteriota bacterium]
MPEYKWPEADKRSLIGKRHSRADGPVKSSGKAKYSSDISRPGMLHVLAVRCPYAHARVTSIDTSEAERMPGVKMVQVVVEPGKPNAETQWFLDHVALVAAETEEQAEDAVRKVKVQYERLPHLVTEYDRTAAGARARPQDAATTGDPDTAFREADVVSEGEYGARFISHCTLEPHGSVTEWKDGRLTAYLPTQALSGSVSQFASPLEVPNTNVRVICNHIGGAFGSKFGPDKWDIQAARMAKAAGRPMRYFTERNAELIVSGGRPSDFATVRIAAKKDGTIIGWQSDAWGTVGPSDRGAAPPLPYVFRKIPNIRTRYTGVGTNTGPSRAWRAPNHPQGCLLTMCALDDCAARLNMDPLQFFLKNISLVQGGRPEDYSTELLKCAEMIDWKKNWHARGDKTPGPIKRGLGLSIHTWGGLGHACQCDVKIHPDGSAEVTMGTQDLGTGTRTVMLVTLAETFGLPLNAVKLNIGDSDYPPGGASGGSTTVGGASTATRRGALDALEQLFQKVAPALGVPPDQLEAVNGKIQVKGNPAKSLAWKQACAKIGTNPIVARGACQAQAARKEKLIDADVGGAQMADVSVDIETGVVTLNKFVAAQDCGLIINLKTAESQMYGAMTMGVGYALYEERVMDQLTGRMLNNNMEFYKLAGLGDIGTIEVFMMTGKGYDERGVIGLGEPPVISPGAAISNAIANAIGVRVPHMPFTPDRVLAALEKGGVA